MFLYDWSGNVRKLKTMLEGVFINLPRRRISLMDLPKPYRQRFMDAAGLQQGERERVLPVLSTIRWNVSKAAQQLHWSWMTLYRKMTKSHIIKGGKSGGCHGCDLRRSTVTPSASL